MAAGVGGPQAGVVGVETSASPFMDPSGLSALACQPRSARRPGGTDGVVEGADMNKLYDPMGTTRSARSGSFRRPAPLASCLAVRSRVAFPLIVPALHWLVGAMRARARRAPIPHPASSTSSTRLA